MTEELFVWLITHFMFFSISMCRSWNKWAMSKEWGEHWEMPGSTIPLKHFMCAKTICSKCWILYIEVLGYRSADRTSKKESVSFDIGRLKERRSYQPKVKPSGGMRTFQEGESRVSLLGLWRIAKAAQGNRNLHFWKITSGKSVSPSVDMDRGVSHAVVSQLEHIIQQVCDAANDSTRQGALGNPAAWRRAAVPYRLKLAKGPVSWCLFRDSSRSLTQLLCHKEKELETVSPGLPTHELHPGIQLTRPLLKRQP